MYEYALTGQDGKEVTLASYKGRILVLEFFATWCPPCRRDLPEIASLQDQYPVEKLAIVAVSADGSTHTESRVPAFLQGAGIKIPALIGSALFIDHFTGVDEKSGRQIVLPQTYVFDAEGEMLLRFVGERKAKKRDLAGELDRVLKEASSS